MKIDTRHFDVCEIRDAETGVFLDGKIVWADDETGEMYIYGTNENGAMMADPRRRDQETVKFPPDTPIMMS